MISGATQEDRQGRQTGTRLPVCEEQEAVREEGVPVSDRLRVLLHKVSCGHYFRNSSSLDKFLRSVAAAEAADAAVAASFFVKRRGRSKSNYLTPNSFSLGAAETAGAPGLPAKPDDP